MYRLILVLCLTAGILAGSEFNPVVRTGGEYPCRRLSEALAEDAGPKEWARAGALPLFLIGGDHAMVNAYAVPGEVAAVCYLLWDDEYLYWAGLVDKPEFFPAPSGSVLYEGDGWQLAFDPPDDSLVPGYDGNDLEIGLAVTANGEESWCFVPGLTLNAGNVAGVIDFRCRQLSPTQRFYTARIPWRVLAPASPQTGTAVGVNMIYNLNDGHERVGWLQWTGGVAEAKMSFLFRNIRLVGAGEGTVEPVLVSDKGHYRSGDRAVISLFLPGVPGQTLDAALTVTERDTVRLQAEQEQETANGFARFDFPYDINRLRRDPLVCTVRTDGGVELSVNLTGITAEELRRDAAALAERSGQLRRTVAEGRSRGIAMDYPLVSAAVADVTLQYRLDDLDHPERLESFRLLPVIRKQFDFLGEMLTRGQQEAEALLAEPGRARPVPVIAPETLAIRDGFYRTPDGEPVYLIGPLGWYEPFHDLELIRDCGFNFLSSTIIVQDITPEPGVKGYGPLGFFKDGLARAREMGLATDFLPSPHPIPQGWRDACPELNDYPGNGWVGASLYTEALRQMIDDYWSVAIPGLADPGLVSIDLVNEWNFADGVNAVHPAMRQRFLAGLRQRYGDIAALNARWRTGFSGWEAIEPLKLKDASVAGFYEWELFRNREADAAAAWMAETARRYDPAPDRPYHIKTIAAMDLNPDIYGPLGVERETRQSWEAISGSDCADTVHLDLYRSLYPEAPASDSEYHISVATTPEEIAVANWSAALHGESHRLFFAWVGWYSAELLAAGALLHTPWTLEANGRSTLDIRRLASEAAQFAALVPEAETGIYFSQTSLLLDAAYPAQLRQCHGDWNNRDFPLRFVSERQLIAGDTGNLKLILIPGGQYGLPEAVAALQSFIDAGGRVAAAPGAPAFTPYGETLPELRGVEPLAGAEPRIVPAFTLEGRPEGSATEFRMLPEGRGDYLVYWINYSAGYRASLKAADGKRIAAITDLVTAEAVEGDEFDIPQRDFRMLRVTLED